MSKAVPPSQQPSSPGLSEADRVSPSTAPERHLADPCVPAPPEAVSDNRPLAVPRTDSGEWTSQFDSFLCQALCSGALNEREAIAAIRATNPGWSREFVWQHVRLLRPETPQQVPRDRYAFSEAEDAFLKESYGKDRRSTRRAIDAILARHPQWPRRAVIERGRQLGLSRKNQHRVARWSEGEMIQLLNLQEKPVRYISKMLNRRPASIRAKLKRMNKTADFFGGFKTKDLMGLITVTEETIERWEALGWLRRDSGRITAKSVEEFCRLHPEEAKLERLDPETANFLSPRRAKTAGAT